ncbi:hypothetical protein ACPCIT_09465 [Pseudomonas siliginis]|uniref:hypothetical protein n=1 Tax=Pseudomonas siliginis TaxID=2842346 RepID=UPI003C2D30B1
MAGDWIKMRIDLQTHPKVFRMVSALKADRLRIIGGLHIAWSIFDTHSDDGVLHGYSVDAMDAVVGWPGFTQAMIEVEWASVQEDGSLVMPRFDEHNGASAKRRANDSERKRNDRKNNCVRNVSASDADKTRTREEKRREEKRRKSKIKSMVLAHRRSLPNSIRSLPSLRTCPKRRGPTGASTARKSASR